MNANISLCENNVKRFLIKAESISNKDLDINIAKKYLTFNKLYSIL